VSRRDDDLAFLVEQRLRRRRRAERVRRRRRVGVLLGLAGASVVVVLLTLGFGAGAALSVSCNLSSLQPTRIGANSFVFAADGSLLGSIPAERNREPVTLARMSRWLPKATVAIEDRRFYRHGGVDYVGIARALWRDISAGKVVQGGSTITQQLVRNLYTGRERTFDRKLKEACLAIKLSDRWSKDKILAGYLNAIYYGNHAYGAQAAAQTYFSENASQLTLAQAALLAGLPQAPSIYDPFHNPRSALVRRGEVLEAMLANGDITRRQYSAARRAHLVLTPGRLYSSIKEPYFFSYVIDELQRVYGATTVREGGLKVFTTIEPRLQRNANKAIRDILDEHDDPAAAIVSVEPGTGAIRAMTAVIPGNTKNQFNLASQSARQAGSTFKSFVLAAAIEQGIDPDTTYYDSAPFVCVSSPWCAGDYKAGKPWEVSTYDHTYVGYTSITRATLRSDNTIYAQLTLDVGPGYVWQMAKRLGVQLTQKPVASIGLGALSVSPLDMAAAYATFASGGIYARPTGITKVVLADGSVDKNAGWGKPQTKRALSPGVAWKVNDILAQNAQYGTGAGSGDGVHPNAGKTGTTEDHADAWFVGYTRDLSTAVWMGYPRGEIPMLNVHGQEVAGATFPVPIWHEYMAAAEWHRSVRQFIVPAKEPVYRQFTRGHWGYTYSTGSSSSSTTTETTTTATTTTGTATTATATTTTAIATTTTAPPAPTTTQAPAPPPKVTTTAPAAPSPKPAPTPPPAPPPATTVTVTTPPPAETQAPPPESTPAPAPATPAPAPPPAPPPGDAAGAPATPG
jgi:penicillin-binding protein 1A